MYGHFFNQYCRFELSWWQHLFREYALHCTYFVNKKRKRHLTKKHTQLTETNKPTGCSQTSAKQQTTVEEQEVGYYNIMMASQFPWWMKQIWEKPCIHSKIDLPLTKSSRIYSILLYKFALIGCFAMIGRCPFFCMDTTASYKLFSRGVNSRPNCPSPWASGWRTCTASPLACRHLHTWEEQEHRPHMWWADASKQIEWLSC